MRKHRSKHIIGKAITIITLFSLLFELILPGNILMAQGQDLTKGVIDTTILKDNILIKPEIIKPINPLGTATSGVIDLPSLHGSYQTFTGGVLVTSETWGSIVISLDIFEKWKSFMNTIGLPRENFKDTKDYQTCIFEKGTIVVNKILKKAYAVYGDIYIHYTEVPWIGYPTSDEMDAPNGGRYQTFDNSSMYWTPEFGAHIVYGAIRDRYLALGGPGGVLGYPKSDELSVLKGSSYEKGTEIGRSSRFKNGVIFFSGATGAFEVTGAILSEYENKYGGPGGWLGFPTSGTNNTPSSGGTYNNFQNGLLVNHATGPYRGTYAFKNLKLYLQRFKGWGEDGIAGIAGSVDLYVHSRLTSSNGVLNDSSRYPGSGEYGSSADINKKFDISPVVQGDLTFQVNFDGWDADDLSSDDHLGTVNRSFSIDNLWGYLDAAERTNNEFQVTYSIQTELPYNKNDYRGDMFWSFHNFTTPELSYDQYSSTFTDVGTNDNYVLNPFNKLYYDEVYKTIADKGNCFGMSLEAINAQVGQSLFTEPISYYSTNPGGGEFPNLLAPTVKNEINIKHGYQLGAASVDWTLYQFVQGKLHNPKYWFYESKRMFEEGDYPVISMGDAYFSSGHTVRPYAWDDSNPNCWIIKVADPNKEKSSVPNDSDSVIKINPESNSFSFALSSTTTWTGDINGGGFLFATPYHTLSEKPRTPFYEVLALIAGSVFIIMGDNASSSQITDGKGNAFYKNGLSDLPSKWNDIQQGSIPNFSRVMLTDQTLTNLDTTGTIKENLPIIIQPIKTKTTPEMYYGKLNDALKFDVSPKKGVTQGALCEWAMNTATLSSFVSLPANPNKADIITVNKLNTPDNNVTVRIPKDSINKSIGFSISGGNKNKWILLNNLKMQPDQAISLHLKGAGQTLVIANDGPKTSATISYQDGSGQKPVEIGVIDINTGVSSGKVVVDANGTKFVPDATPTPTPTVTPQVTPTPTPTPTAMPVVTPTPTPVVEHTPAPTPVPTAVPIANTMILTIGNPYMFVNGVSTEIDPGRNTIPVIVNNRTLVPIRAIIENMGGKVDWDSKSSKAIINARGTNIEMTLNSNKIKVNNIEKEMDVAPQIINNRTMLPLRFVVEELNCKVEWEPNSRRIIISY